MSQREDLDKVQVGDLEALSSDGPLHIRDLDHARTIIAGWRAAFGRWRSTAKRVHEENGLLRGIVEHEVEYHQAKAARGFCRAGCLPGRGVEICEHCDHVERAAAIGAVLEEIDAAKAEAERAQRERLGAIARQAAAEHAAEEGRRPGGR